MTALYDVAHLSVWKYYVWHQLQNFCHKFNSSFHNTLSCYPRYTKSHLSWHKTMVLHCVQHFSPCPFISGKVSAGVLVKQWTKLSSCGNIDCVLRNFRWMQKVSFSFHNKHIFWFFVDKAAFLSNQTRSPDFEKTFGGSTSNIVPLVFSPKFWSCVFPLLQVHCNRRLL